MKASASRPASRLVGKVPKCGYDPGKVAGPRATVKAEMNGVTPEVTSARRPVNGWTRAPIPQSAWTLSF